MRTFSHNTLAEFFNLDLLHYLAQHRTHRLGIFRLGDLVVATLARPNRLVYSE